MASTFKILMTLGLMALLACCVMAQDVEDDDFNRFRDNYSKGSKGPCPGGYWADGSGCCPEIIKGKAYYRDGNKCYPSDLDCGVFYADGCGCYPDQDGEYLKDGESCPNYRQCHQRCIRPDDDCEETTTTDKHYTTPKHYETTTEKHTTPKYETTTHKEYTTEKRTTPKYETTTTEECKETTTSEKRTTPKHYETTTEKRTTTTEKYTTPKHYETTTSAKYDRQCGYGQYKDGKGCCPRKFSKYFYYPDGQGCYPTATAKGILYADSNRCYPDEQGKYLKAGQSCPASRVCKAECDATSFY